MALGDLQNVIDHRFKAHVLFILQADVTGAVHRDAFDIFRPLQQPLGLQLFTAKANDHHFAAEVRVKGDIVDGAYWYHRRWRINRYAAAIEVIQTHHAVDVGIFRQQVAFNEFHHVIDHARNAVHAGGDTQQIFGAHAAIGIAVACEGIAFQRRQRGRHFGGQRQGVQRRGGGQLH